MSDFDLKQTRSVREDDPRPLLSLNPQAGEKKPNKNNLDPAEQEALWSRSLEFFEQMKSAHTH